MNITVLSHTDNPEDVIARAARQCYSAESAAIIELSDDDKKRLIQKIIRNGHHSCLEHASITYAIGGISRVCTHQLVRHRMASYSQRSQRYVLESNNDYVIPATVWEANISDELITMYLDNANRIYDLLIKSNVPKEDARYFLPSAITTDIVVTMNFRELLHFFELRCSKHAQWEIRQLANEMLLLAREIAPTVFNETEETEDDIA